MNSLSSVMPNVVVQPMSDNFLDEMSYIPGLSNLKAIETLAFSILCAVAAPIYALIGSALWLVGYDRCMGVFIALDLPLSLNDGPLFLNYAPSLAVSSVMLLGRAILESIPVAGNLALGFLDGRIQINCQHQVA